MASQKKDEIQNGIPKNRPATPIPDVTTGGNLPKELPTSAERLNGLAARPHRNLALHWVAFVLSLASLVILVTWVTGPRGDVPRGWVWLDVGLAAFFALEFFTRSGFRWNPIGYVISHIFDFVAIAPALGLIYLVLPFQGVWVWLILVARIVRVIDRLLGDGFVRRNALALAEGFEEEITDRVLLRIMSRIRTEIGRGSLAGGLAEALVRNKDSVLQRVRAQHPQQGLVASVAQITGLDEALARAEERTYDAIVEIVKSPEVDRAIREAVDSGFSVIQTELGVRSWRQNLGFGRRRVDNRSEGPPISPASLNDNRR